MRVADVVQSERRSRMLSPTPRHSQLPPHWTYSPPPRRPLGLRAPSRLTGERRDSCLATRNSNRPSCVLTVTRGRISVLLAREVAWNLKRFKQVRPKGLLWTKAGECLTGRDGVTVFYEKETVLQGEGYECRRIPLGRR